MGPKGMAENGKGDKQPPENGMGFFCQNENWMDKLWHKRLQWHQHRADRWHREERCDDLDLREDRIWFSRIMDTVECDL